MLFKISAIIKLAISLQFNTIMKVIKVSPGLIIYIFFLEGLNLIIRENIA